MRSITHLTGLAAALLSASISAAELRTPSVYVGFDIGRSSVSSKVYEEDGDPSFGIAVGYAVNPHLAVEVFSRSMSLRLFDGLGNDTNHYPYNHVGVAAIGAVQLSERLRLLGRVGIGRTKMKADTTRKPDYKESDASLGIGLSYDFSPGWSVQLNSARFMDTKVTTTVLGMAYRF